MLVKQAKAGIITLIISPSFLYFSHVTCSSQQELRWNMIGELLHRLGSGKRERPEMKNDFWFIKHSSVFLIKFFWGEKMNMVLIKTFITWYQISHQWYSFVLKAKRENYLYASYCLRQKLDQVLVMHHPSTVSLSLQVWVNKRLLNSHWAPDTQRLVKCRSWSQRVSFQVRKRYN